MRWRFFQHISRFLRLCNLVIGFFPLVVAIEHIFPSRSCLFQGYRLSPSARRLQYLHGTIQWFMCYVVSQLQSQLRE
jgi:hypothetical protein